MITAQMLAVAPQFAVSDRYTVYALVALLTAVGIAMIVLTVWLVRMTRPEHEALSALDVMSSRRFRREGTLARERRLADVRGPVVAVDASSPTDRDTQTPAEPDPTGAVPRLEPWEATAGPDGSSAALGDESEASAILDSGDDLDAPDSAEDPDAADAGDDAEMTDEEHPAAHPGGTIG